MQVMSRLDEWIRERPAHVVSLAILYFTIVHVLFLGFESFDGFGFRVAPVVELVQRREYWEDLWELAWVPYATPVFELVHVPFLALLGLPGLLFSFSLILLPLACMAVFHFLRVASQGGDVAAYGTIAFLAVPFVNNQPFAGYVDFAVAGCLVFFMAELLLIVRQERARWTGWSRFALATLIYSFARQQTVYLAAALFALVFVAHAVQRGVTRGVLIETLSRNLWVFGVFMISIAPAILVHLVRWQLYGTPDVSLSVPIWAMADRRRLLANSDKAVVPSGDGCARVGACPWGPPTPLPPP